jgi:hypothetical protein
MEKKRVSIGTYRQPIASPRPEPPSTQVPASPARPEQGYTLPPLPRVDKRKSLKRSEELDSPHTVSPSLGTSRSSSPVKIGVTSPRTPRLSSLKQRLGAVLSPSPRKTPRDDPLRDDIAQRRATREAEDAERANWSLDLQIVACIEELKSTETLLRNDSCTSRALKSHFLKHMPASPEALVIEASRCEVSAWPTLGGGSKLDTAALADDPARLDALCATLTQFAALAVSFLTALRPGLDDLDVGHALAAMQARFPERDAHANACALGSALFYRNVLTPFSDAFAQVQHLPAVQRAHLSFCNRVIQQAVNGKAPEWDDNTPLALQTAIGAANEAIRARLAVGD